MSAPAWSVFDEVRASTAWLLDTVNNDDNNPPLVTIDEAVLKAELESNPELYSRQSLPPDWAQSYHFCDGTDLTVQYVFVLDALNFCFWPLEGYEYEHLANSLKLTLEDDAAAFSAENLERLTAETLSEWLLRGFDGEDAKIPFAAERARLLREVGRALRLHFDGLAANMVRAANKSASDLASLVTAHFPGFRDHAVCGGRQIFFYKRAQILVGDLWGAFKGKGLGEFHDIGNLTCFADYRIPQLLYHLKVLVYSDDLKEKVESRTPLPAGTPAELQIRAATVQVVERMRELLGGADKIHSLQLDWLLWERGEAMLAALPPHHRVSTIFY